MEQTHTSSPKKLVKFFEKSRNNWKNKYQELKTRHRNLQRKQQYTNGKIALLQEKVSSLTEQLPKERKTNTSNISEVKKKVSH
jgi:chromosome segregation ATPase